MAVDKLSLLVRTLSGVKNLKIAYYLELDPVKHLGVYNKVMTHVQEWQKHHDVRVYMISHCDHEHVEAEDFVNLFSSFLVKTWHSPASKYLNRVLCFQTCKKAISDFRPDVIYYRLNVYYPGLGGLFKIAKTVIEVNHPVRSSEGSYPAVVEKSISMINELTLIKASGYVCTSEHIKESLNESGYKAKKLVLANGISFSDAVPQRNQSYSRPRLIMIGSPGQSWQGYDKFLEMAQYCPEYDFFLVGPDKNQIDSDAPGNFNFLGFKTQKELYSIYRNMDIGVGTLAAYRKGISEASPLKTREYAKYGLPMIIGYDDTDLSASHEKICNIGNYPGNVSDNLKRIARFIDRFSNLEKCINGYEVLCSIRKERKRVRFLSELAGLE
ncbi:MAG: hypothetical protein ACR2PT_01135 [Endozoicomonas sp.]